MNEIGKTESICPVCLKRIPARLEAEADNVFMVKDCEDHGEFKTIVWEGPPAFQSWKRPKIPTTPPVIRRQVEKGCPFDCGLCPDHRQRSCTIILEVTSRCNLACSFCYADSDEKIKSDPNLKTIKDWYKSAAEAGHDFHIQLSGGEPTVRDDLPAIVALGREYGFYFIQINTNGLRLAHDDRFVRKLKAAGLNSVFLQFDGLDPDTYLKIRGRNLLNEKLGAVEACARHGLGVVLVPTLVPGINTGEIGALVKKALELSPVVRAIHFQPVSYFGRIPKRPDDGDRITLPRLMRKIEEQTNGLFKAEDFKPPGCENALCSFHANYMVMAGGEVRLLGGGSSCCSKEPEPAEQGAARTVARVSRQWGLPEESRLPVIPMAPDEESEKILSLDDFLIQARRNTFSVSAMAFQDAWNIDLERVRDCCIHIMKQNGELAPFCAYNLTNMNGKGLYR